MRRFYRQAEIARSKGGFTLALDGKPVRTPAGAALLLPTAALAEAVAEEWRAQGERIEPGSMPLSRLANTAIDRVAPRRAAVVAEIAAYAETDLVCYRAERPQELAARQIEAWEPLVRWAAERHGAMLRVTNGLTPEPQPEGALAALGAAVEAFDDLALAALQSATAAAGSLVIALALAEGRLDAEAAFRASALDEAFQAERWGEDAEAARRREEIRADLADAARFLALARG